MKDRKEDFIKGNKAVCQDDCFLADYNYTTKKANCSCDAKEMPLSFADMNINKSKLYQNLIDIKNIANVKMLVCYKKLLTKDGIIFNIGSYIIFAIIIFHIVTLFVFYIKQFNTLKKKIKNIVFAIKNLIIRKPNKNGNAQQSRIINTKNNNVGGINKINNINNRNRSELINRRNQIIRNAKNNNNKSIRLNNNKKNNINNINNNKSIRLNDKSQTRWNKPIFGRINLLQENTKSKERIEMENRIRGMSLRRFNRFKRFPAQNALKSSSRRSLGNSNVLGLKKNSILKPKMNNHKQKNERINEIMEYIDEEKNILPYNLALIHDSRSYVLYYLSLLKTKHNFFFSFCYSEITMQE